MPQAQRHDYLPGTKGYFNAAALQHGTGPLWVCEGAFDALALLATGGCPGLERSSACRAGGGIGYETYAYWPLPSSPLPPGSSSGRRARQAALQGKRVAVLESEAYGGQKDVSAAWAAGVLTVGAGPATTEGKARAVSRA